MSIHFSIHLFGVDNKGWNMWMINRKKNSWSIICLKTLFHLFGYFQNALIHTQQNMLIKFNSDFKVQKPTLKSLRCISYAVSFKEMHHHQITSKLMWYTIVHLQLQTIIYWDKVKLLLFMWIISHFHMLCAIERVT